MVLFWNGLSRLDGATFPFWFAAIPFVAALKTAKGAAPALGIDTRIRI